MIKIGQINQLEIVKFVSFGLYLDGGDAGEILLPKRYMPEDIEIGDEIDVFIYKDTNDDLISTTQLPNALVGECALLSAKDKSEAGIFMDWGLTKDLLVPYNEQAYPMTIGRHYVVYVFLDERTNRIAASTKFSFHLCEEGEEFEVGEEVDLMIVGKTDLGYKAAIEETHLGLIFHQDIFQELRFGQQLRGFIKRIRDDGKIDLTLQKATDETRDSLEDKILVYMRAMGGKSNITDKSPPDMIYKVFECSKKNYKKALGGLYKQKKILIEKDLISLIEDETKADT